MSYKVDNAIIMAAGYSSRFAPLSYECPKSLLKIKGEVLIERQIKQLREAGIGEIIVVVGYKKEQFDYLVDKYNVILIENKDFNIRNNHSTIFVAKNYLKNTYICSSDNYFSENPFESYVDDSYYSAVYGEGETKEWCLKCDESDRIINVTIGGKNSWYMMGHAFWSNEFSDQFITYLESEYELQETKNKFWEEIYMDHIDVLDMKIRRYENGIIYEFDSLDELRQFDDSYVNETGSAIMKMIANTLKCEEKNIVNITPKKNENGEVEGIYFFVGNKKHSYQYHSMQTEEVST